jgi:hypothetical protein
LKEQDGKKAVKKVYFQKKRKTMQNKKNQTSVGQMIQRCHKWRQKRKQYIDQARQTTDEIERERLLQTAEHYGRIVNEEQIKIDSQRDPKDKNTAIEEIAESVENSDTKESDEDEEMGFPDFIANLK